MGGGRVNEGKGWRAQLRLRGHGEGFKQEGGDWLQGLIFEQRVENGLWKKGKKARRPASQIEEGDREIGP